MPARKPSTLITRHETAAEKQARAERESAMRPENGLPAGAPARISGHAVAEATWRRLMRVYGELEGEIVTRLDMDLLVDYCLLMEQTIELDAMRQSAKEIWEQFNQARREALEKNELDKAQHLGGKTAAAFDAVVKLDSRADRKRALLLQLRQVLYLTPRARAGVAPAAKEEEPPKDDLEMLLDDVVNTLNGEKGNDR